MLALDELVLEELDEVELLDWLLALELATLLDEELELLEGSSANTALSGVSQRSAIFWLPLSLGWTPS